ncbi:twist-related protein 1-like [Ammospiza caudacuta]|uniref:twist-related protein 1-like n=1 Tax=Ammospiza caudacuta TaxID=2857398 RepID=UPI00273824AC|nr:twist-related protein 1-like [Ammospiza caudacuta]
MKKRVTARGKGTNSDKHEAVSVVRGLREPSADGAARAERRPERDKGAGGSRRRRRQGSPRGAALAGRGSADRHPRATCPAAGPGHRGQGQGRAGGGRSVLGEARRGGGGGSACGGSGREEEEEEGGRGAPPGADWPPRL